jgi:hypothetical protein
MVEIINIYGDADPEEIRAVQAVCSKAKELAELIEEYCPEGYEVDHALFRLRECVFWANSAIIE